MKQATGSNTPQSINKVSIQLTLDGHSFSAPALSGEFPGDGPVEVELLTPRTTLVPEEFFDEACAGELLAAAGMARRACRMERTAAECRRRHGRGGRCAGCGA